MQPEVATIKDGVIWGIAHFEEGSIYIERDDPASQDAGHLTQTSATLTTVAA